MKRKRVFYRTVDTGLFVTEAYALQNPKTTLREVREIEIPSKKKKRKS